MAQGSGRGRRYSADDRLAAAVFSGLAGCLVTVIPFVALTTVLDAFHPVVVVAWVLLPGVVGYAAPGLFARLIRPHDPYFGRRGEPSEDAWASWVPSSSFPAPSDSDGDHGGVDGVD